MGTPNTVAAEMPASTIDMARAFEASGTSCVAAPGAKVQKPPMHRPSMQRATSMVAKLGANAASKFEATSSARERDHHGAPVEPARGHDQRRPGEGGQHAGHGDHQAGRAVGDVQAGGDVGQQADGQELGRDHREGADGDRADREPGGTRGLLQVRGREQASSQVVQGAFMGKGFKKKSLGLGDGPGLLQ